MIDYTKREAFVYYLDNLLKGKASDAEWAYYIVEHYFGDERLEDIRRDIVRLRIAAGNPRRFPNNVADQQKLRDWAEELRQ